MTPGVRIWVWISIGLTAYLGLFTCAGLAGEGDFLGVVLTLLLTPVLFWVLATVGAGVINVFTVVGQVMDAQVTESAAIQGKGREIRPRNAPPAPAVGPAAPPPTHEPARAEESDGLAVAAAFGAWLALQTAKDAEPVPEEPPEEPERCEGAFASAFASGAAGADEAGGAGGYDGDWEGS